MSLEVENLGLAGDNQMSLGAVVRPTAPYNFRQSLKSLRDSGAADLNDSFGEENNWIERPVQLNGRAFLLRLTDASPSPEAPALNLTLLADDKAEAAPGAAELEAATEWANRRFLLDVDMQAVRETLAVDQYGEELVVRYWPVRPANLPSAWEGLLKTVISNQIYPGLAVKLLRALLDFYGEAARFEGKEYRFYPTAERLAILLPEDLLDKRFSRQKARFVPGIAQAVMDEPEKFSWERLRQIDSEEAIATLDELPGVGPWTAHYVAMRGLPHLDVFVDEEGLRKTLATAHDRRAGISSEEAAKLMKIYRPYRSFACYYSYMLMYAA
jgi:3-methyladenine DNA glycosylase/8-oxoguanine DNA glycosylase